MMGVKNYSNTYRYGKSEYLLAGIQPSSDYYTFFDFIKANKRNAQL